MVALKVSVVSVRLDAQSTPLPLTSDVNSPHHPLHCYTPPYLVLLLGRSWEQSWEVESTGLGGEPEEGSRLLIVETMGGRDERMLQLHREAQLLPIAEMGKRQRLDSSGLQREAQDLEEFSHLLYC